MKINIFHYHLLPGGVTRIIRSQLEGLAAEYPGWDLSVYAGQCPDTRLYEDLGAEVNILEELNYLERRDYSFEEVHQRVTSLTRHLSDRIERDQILHFHNLNLGKNPIVTLAVHRLASTGHRVFNHVHDLAEDRPSNIEFIRSVIEDSYGVNMQEVLYPKSEKVRFGALNSRDVERLHDSGIGRDRIHFLPNPVKMGEVRDIDRQKARRSIAGELGLDPAKKIITYPVRVIRRKNIGEYILLTALFHEEAGFLVTLPPQNPIEVVPYEEWKDFCRREKIPVHFEAGTRVDFDELLTATDLCITTSSMEGFGMVFMEPWLMGTPVAGRNIDYVTRDLTGAGMEFSILYDTLQVPGSKEDFKDLDPDDQRKIILKVWRDEKDIKKKLFALNPWMRSLLKVPGKEIIERNMRKIKNEFSLKKYTQRLYEAYNGYTDGA